MTYRCIRARIGHSCISVNSKGESVLLQWAYVCVCVWRRENWQTGQGEWVAFTCALLVCVRCVCVCECSDGDNRVRLLPKLCAIQGTSRWHKAAWPAAGNCLTFLKPRPLRSHVWSLWTLPYPSNSVHLGSQALGTETGARLPLQRVLSSAYVFTRACPFVWLDNWVDISKKMIDGVQQTFPKWHDWALVVLEVNNFLVIPGKKWGSGMNIFEVFFSFLFCAF